MPRLRTIIGLALALYLAHRFGHPEALGAWGGYSGPRRSSGGGHVRTRSVRRVAAHPSRHGGHHVTGHVRRVAAHPSVRARVARHGVSSGHRSSRPSTALHGAAQRQAATHLAAFAHVLAQKGYSRKVARAFFTALAVKGSGLNYLLKKSPQQWDKHDVKRIKGFLSRAKAREHKYHTPAYLAAAASGRGGVPLARFKKWAPLARNQLRISSQYWLKRHPEFAYGTHYKGGKFGGQKGLFQRIGGKYGIDPRVLWSIYRIESAHGTNPGTSSAGAQGPMQFMPGTWASYGRGKSIQSLPASVDAAARYLKAAGAPKDYRRAVYAYNHAGWYVNDVLSKAHLAEFGKGGSGKKVRVKRKGGPYKLIRQAYHHPKKGPTGVPGGSATAGVTGSSAPSRATFHGAGSSRSSGASKALSAAQGASQAAVGDLVAQLQQQAVQPALQAPSAPGYNAQSALSFPSGFTEIGSGGFQPTIYNPLTSGGFGRRRGLSSYLAGR